ncbi:MAG: cytochrome P450 [Myxococcales bacterium]|jgi:cholest-4-en-3-one 26-monooxygenase|nr:MAG: cytochrome P450 [Myxococcales bacterium]
MQLSDIDLFDLDGFANGAPHDVFDLLRREAPVFWHEEPGGPGFWAVTRHADVQYVSRTPAIFGSAPNTNIQDPDPERIAILGEIMINMDPPRHNAYRNTINKGFVPKRVAKLESYITGVAEGIVDAVAPRGECDFVEDVAALLPMTMICELFGIPDADRRYAYELANRLTSSDDPEIQDADGTAEAAFAETFEFAVRLGEEKKKNPADDLASLVVNAKIDGKPVDDLVFGTFVMMMIVAGNETTRTVTSNGMIRLIEHPDQMQALVQQPSRIPVAVEEILRYEPGVHHFRRTAREDTELGGTSIRKGDKVVVWYPAANRDAEVFDDPHTFNIARSNASAHLTFGIGQHYCLGAALARAQLCTIFHEVLTRLPDIELVEPPRRLRSNFINGVKEMRVRFTPTSSPQR